MKTTIFIISALLSAPAFGEDQPLVSTSTALTAASASVSAATGASALRGSGKLKKLERKADLNEARHKALMEQAESLLKEREDFVKAETRYKKGDPFENAKLAREKWQKLNPQKHYTIIKLGVHPIQQDVGNIPRLVTGDRQVLVFGTAYRADQAAQIRRTQSIHAAGKQKIKKGVSALTGIVAMAGLAHKWLTMEESGVTTSSEKKIAPALGVSDSAPAADHDLSAAGE